MGTFGSILSFLEWIEFFGEELQKKIFIFKCLREIKFPRIGIFPTSSEKYSYVLEKLLKSQELELAEQRGD